MNNRLLFKSRYQPALSAIREARKGLTPLLNSHPLSTAESQKIELLVAEAMTNLVRHASPAPSFIELQVRVDHEYFWVELADDGGYWDPLQNDAGLPAAFELNEQGLGVKLIRSLSDRQQYGAVAGTNRLALGLQRADRKELLLVDDDPSQRRLLSAYLEPYYEVIVAASGQEALELLRQHRVSLVLSDIRMPDMDGLELKAQINSHPEFRLLPFLLLTGQDCDASFAEASTLGVDDYLTKPVDKTRLLQSLHRVRERQRQLAKELQERLDGEITSALRWQVPAMPCQWRCASFSKNTGLGGGDFLLHHRLDQQQLLVVADTMGHDESAKFFSHAFAGYLRGFINATAGRLQPAALLSKLSDAAWQDQLFARTTLSCCMLLLKEHGAIDVVTGGHPPPLLISARGVEPLDVSGVLPGLIPGATYQHLSLTLQPGTRLLVYTDGLFDSADSADERARLETAITRSVRETLTLPIEQARAQVEQLFDRRAGLLPKDDASLLLIESVPPPPDR